MRTLLLVAYFTVALVTAARTDQLWTVMIIVPVFLTLLGMSEELEC
jgi:hypothetical protein